MTPNPTNWRKSARSHQVSNCVEVGSLPAGAAVRDTKDRAAGYITANQDQWSAFVLAIKSGRYDR